jgi:hypothetical protein
VLGLKPRTGAMGRVFRQALVSGGSSVERVVLEDGNGDRSEIDIRDVQYDRAGLTWKKAVVSEDMSDSLQNPARGWKFWLALALVSLLVACMALVVVPRLRIETNLLALLPSTRKTRCSWVPVRRFAERSSRELVFGRGDLPSARSLRRRVLHSPMRSRSSGAFARIDYLVDDRYIAAAHADAEIPQRNAVAHGTVSQLMRGDDGGARERKPACRFYPARDDPPLRNFR